jgi:hypothetical protein
VPEAPDVMVIHAALLTAVQPQPDVAVTDTDPVDAAAAAVALEGFGAETQEVENDHVADAFAPTLFRAPTAQ